MNSTLDTVLSLASAMGSLATAAGVVYLAIQVADARRTTTATLIHELEQHFRENYGTYTKLLDGGDWAVSGSGPQTAAEQSELEAYFEFFEKIAIMLDRKVLSLEEIDLMYGFRFFLAMNNPHSQVLLERDLPYWTALIDLCQRWREYRIGAGLPILNEAHDFVIWLKSR